MCHEHIHLHFLAPFLAGLTPQRRSFVYPAALTCTQPHEELKKEFRVMQQLQGIEEEEDEHHSSTNANTQEPTDPTDEAVNKYTHTHTTCTYIWKCQETCHIEVSGNSLCFINPRHIYVYQVESNHVDWYCAALMVNTRCLFLC